MENEIDLNKGFTTNNNVIMETRVYFYPGVMFWDPYIHTYCKMHHTCENITMHITTTIDHIVLPSLIITTTNSHMPQLPQVIT